MVRRYGGGHHHGAGTSDMIRVVPLMHFGSEFGNVRRPRRVGIASTHLDTPAASDERQSTHPGAADSHEVDRS
jgi:hypothetical protein